MKNPSLSKTNRVSRWRFLRAYGVTFRILIRYLRLYFWKKLLPEPHRIIVANRTHEITARQIVGTILKLKGVYIKVGQTLSVMTNFLPPAFTAELEQLQDSVPPHPYWEVENRFILDFHKSPKDLFASFEEKPIASASLGQVHVAYLKDGTKLAVKLQYPNIDDLVHSDLRTLKNIFGILNTLFPHYNISRAYEESSEMIIQELNFEHEGKQLEKIKNNFKSFPQYIFPKVYWEYSSKKILTAEFIDGMKVTHLDALKKANLNPHDVAVGLIHSYCKQIFIDGIYHADPHPGNIIIQAGAPTPPPPLPTLADVEEGAPLPSEPAFLEPKIAMVDFGATATVRPEMKAGMTLFVEGLIKKDTQLLSSAMKQMGFIAKEENEESLDKIVDYFYGKIRGIKVENFKEIHLSDFQHLNDILELKKMDISFKELATTFHIPKDWILLERTLILMMGLVAHLDPYLNPVDIVLPYVEEFVLGKDKKITDIIIQTTKEVLLSYINLPTEIHKTLKKLQDGKISFSDRVQKKNMEKMVAAVHQLIYALFLILCVTLGYLFHKEGNQELVNEVKYVSSFFGIMLLGSFLRNR